MSEKLYGATPESTHTTPAREGVTLAEILDEWESSPNSLVYQLARDMSRLKQERDEVIEKLRVKRRYHKRYYRECQRLRKVVGAAQKACDELRHVPRCSNLATMRHFSWRAESLLRDALDKTSGEGESGQEVPGVACTDGRTTPAIQDPSPVSSLADEPEPEPTTEEPGPDVEPML